MTRHRSPLAVTAALALAVSAAAPLAAAAPGRALAPDGTVYAVTQGRYGDLFPRGTETVADDPVLAVTVIRPDGTAERHLVPETAGPEAEEPASLVLGPGGDALYVLWQASASGSRLRLADLGGAGWGDVVEVSRAVGMVPGTARAVVTRDRTDLPAGGGEAPARVERSILHVAWLEAPGGSAIYAPLVIENGTYIGDHALYALDRLADAGGALGAGAAAPVGAGTVAAPVLEPGESAGSAVAAFTDPESGLLVTVELRMVSGELSDVGNRLREGILERAARLEPGSAGSLRELAAGTRAHLIELGGRLNPGLLGLLAAEIERYVLATGSDWAFQPETMAERTRGELLALGAALDRAPIERTNDEARPQLISVGHRSEGPLPSHDLRLRVAAARPAPALPESAVGSLFLSGDGADALVAWVLDGAVYFRESDAAAEGGWGPVRALGIAAGEDSLIDDMLRERARNR